MSIGNMITVGLAALCLVLYIARRRSRLRLEDD